MMRRIDDVSKVHVDATTTATQAKKQQRTIFALSSGAGKAGVSLIRISGSNAGDERE
jgi:hypothetical protein